MTATRSTPRTQQGSMLLEALIAILIFSLGIIAIVGLQATSIRLSSDAKYRADASLLAEQLLGQMWVSNRAAGALETSFRSATGAASAGGMYSAWLTQNVQRADRPLPGAGTTVSAPVVTFSGAASSVVTITMYWQGPGDTSAHKYTTIAQIQ